VRGSLDALEGGREALYLASFVDDAADAGGPLTIDTLVHAQVQKKDEVRAYYRMMRRIVGQLDTTPLSIKGIGDFVIAEYMISGEQYAPLGYVPVPPDHEARLDIVDVIEMRDAKIAHVWRYDGADWPQP
jgi:hypothetical protein